jgi:serine/threonine protein kinase
VRLSATLRDEWRWLEQQLAQAGGAVGRAHEQPLKELIALARETAAFVDEQTRRSGAQRVLRALSDRARLRALGERLGVLQQRLQLSLQIDTAVALRERVAEAVVLDLTAEAEAVQDMVEGRLGDTGVGAAEPTADQRIDPAALDALLSEMLAALQVARADERRAADERRRAPGALAPTELHPAAVERGESLHRAGGAGELYRGSFGGATVALKVFRGCGEREADEVRREVGVQMAMGFPHVLHAYGAITRDPSQLCIVLELAPHGSLLDAMRASAGQPPSASHLARCGLHVTAGVAHLHSRRVSHGDLKSANVLLCAGDVWKICDFGLARAKLTSRATHSRLGGTCAWMAPELLDAERCRTAMADKADCYALGCVYYELLAWATPWAGRAEYAIMDDVRAGRRPRLPVERAQPAELRPLEEAMRELWAAEPAARPPVDLALVARVRRLGEAAAAAAVAAAGGAADAQPQYSPASSTLAEHEPPPPYSAHGAHAHTPMPSAPTLPALPRAAMPGEAAAREAAAREAAARASSVAAAGAGAEDASLDALCARFGQSREQLLAAKEIALTNKDIGGTDQLVLGLAVLLKRNKTLTKLDLNNSALGAEAVRILAGGLEGNTTLNYLSLECAVRVCVRVRARSHLTRCFPRPPSLRPSLSLCAFLLSAPSTRCVQEQLAGR